MEYHRTATVFGATGLVGEQIIYELIQHPEFSRIKAITRKPLAMEHNKLLESVVDFDNWDGVEQAIEGEVVFCALGTTMKKAGSKEKFRYIDFELPLKIALAAHKKGVEKFFVVSSIGADSKSNNFYLRTKGELEEALKDIPFKSLAVFRPSLLLGKRKEFRFGEKIGIMLYKLLKFLFVGPMKKYKGVHASSVAKAMVRLADYRLEYRIVESSEIRDISKRKS